MRITCMKGPMSDETSGSLHRRLEAIHRQYERHFAGQARVSRDAGLLDAMSEELDEVTGELASQAGADKEELEALIQERRELYATEAASIRTAQADPRAQEIYEVMTWVQVGTGRYRRHFAGQSRSTRDQGLLNELIADAERHRALLEGIGGEDVKDTVESLRSSAELYRSELEQVVRALNDSPVEQRGGALAQAANGQFSIYRDRFVEHPRLSRRPVVLERVIHNLESLVSQMRAIQDEEGVGDAHERNIELVDDRLRFYRGELASIRDSKSVSSVADLVTSLAEAANAVFQRYGTEFAGQDRRTRDPEMLCSMIEELYDVGRQMEDLQRFAQLPANGTNLRLVLDALRLYDHEYEHVVRARAN